MFYQEERMVVFSVVPGCGEQVHEGLRDAALVDFKVALMSFEMPTRLFSCYSTRGVH
jgi:hypothetical protein